VGLADAEAVENDDRRPPGHLNGSRSARIESGVR
jgi:hypothetical protein